jgi:uncharacterized membrane protein
MNGDLYRRRADWMRKGSLLALLAMLAAIALQTLVAPSGNREPSVIIWLLFSVPLLIFVPGVWRGGLRSHAWLSFVSLLYFAGSVTALFAGLRFLNILELIATIALFTCTLLFVRWRARADRA